MILRDSNFGVISAARHVLFFCNDALEAEMLAMQEGMALAIQRSNLPILVQSDSVSALSSLSNSSLVRSSYGHLLQEIKLLILEREFVPVKIARSKNRVSHCLTNYARTLAIPLVSCSVGHLLF